MKFLPFAYILMLVVIFVLPFYSFENYSIIEHTTSQLGAQYTPNSWIMNLTFVLLGGSAIHDGWSYLDNYWFQKIALVVFGGALLLTGVYSHAPIQSLISFDVREDEIHSIFASLTGWAFTVFAVSMAFVDSTLDRKRLAITIAFIATLLSVLMFQVDEIQGIWQRLIFIISFGWMIFIFRDPH